MKIILADDQVLYRDALACYIERAEPEATTIHAWDFRKVIDVLESSDDKIDLAIADMRLPGMDGLSGLRRLLTLYAQVPVIILAEATVKSEMQRVMNLGASGYFPKTLSGKKILQAVYKIMQGEKPVFLDADPFVEEVAPITQPASLTPREKQVLSFLLRGASNKDIAASLGLQIVTVKLHVRGICRKLGAKNRVQAALLAQQGDLEY